MSSEDEIIVAGAQSLHGAGAAAALVDADDDDEILVAGATHTVRVAPKPSKAKTAIRHGVFLHW